MSDAHSVAVAALGAVRAARMLTLTTLVLCMTAFTPVQAQQAASAAEEYAALVIGSFSTERQARADARYDVVEARIARIWPARSEGVWLYQEQSVLGPASGVDLTARQTPYFQRIVHVETIGRGVVRTTSNR